jgi:tRNA threonylcarbamoyl adenosine modification protein YeaZ
MKTTTPERFLCLDTSTPTARVAVLDAGGAVLFAVEAIAERHSSQVLPLCAEALAAAALRPAELAGIACGGGPGSFTGLRVGLAVAKGLALPTGVPLFVVSSLEALAVDILASRPGAGAGCVAVPCLDAGKGEIYVAAFVSGVVSGSVAGLGADGERLVRELASMRRLTPLEVPSWLAALTASEAWSDASPLASPMSPVLAGNGADRYRDLLAATDRAEVAGPTAVSVGRLALLQRARGEGADLVTAIPFYGRLPDITVKRRPG